MNHLDLIGIFRYNFKYCRMHMTWSMFICTWYIYQDRVHVYQAKKISSKKFKEMRLYKVFCTQTNIKFIFKISNHNKITAQTSNIFLKTNAF